MKRVSEKCPVTGIITFEGKTDKKGRKQGRGIEYTPECILHAYFVNDLAEGPVEMIFHDDKSRAEAHMTKGKLDGPYKLFDKNGQMVLDWIYKNGEKHGQGVQILNGKCRLEGTWKNGWFHGKDNKFIYPNGITIRGEVVEDEFISGVYETPTGKKIKKLKPEPINRDQMPDDLKDYDPYEKATIYVKKTKDKGDGMFAKVPIAKGTLWSLYSGILIPNYQVDRRIWDFNSNTIEWDEKFSIDVPEPYHKMSHYTASLGHKANHSFEANAKYTYLDHPKFGDIMSVVAIKDIKKHEEIVVDYGYERHSHGPKWYQLYRKAYKKQKKREEKAQKKQESDSEAKTKLTLRERMLKTVKRSFTKSKRTK